MRNPKPWVHRDPIEDGKLVDARTGQMRLVRKPDKESIDHKAIGSVRFLCPCGQMNRWPDNPRPGKRIPEPHRNKTCTHCGVLHTR